MDYEPAPNASRGLVLRCILLNYLVDVVTDPERPLAEGQQYVLYQGDDISGKPHRENYGDAIPQEVPFEEGVNHLIDLASMEDGLHCYVETRMRVTRIEHPVFPYSGGFSEPQSQPIREQVTFIVFSRIQELFGNETAELSNVIHPREPGTTPDWIDVKEAIHGILRRHWIDGSFKQLEVLPGVHYTPESRV